MTRILLVEDEPLVASAYTRRLTAAGHTVVAVESALGAIDLLSGESLGKPAQFDIVLLDLTLRGTLSGLDVLRKIPPHIHRVVISGLTARSVRERADPLQLVPFFFEKPLTEADWRHLMHVISAAAAQESR